ncbi:MAG: hypothetical protein AAB552_00075 [Patescibacteria group bacterium]
MTPLLVYTLITHVMTGILAIGLVHLVFMHFLKKAPSWKYLQALSGWSVILFLVSWATSAFYYVTYYGKAVKPKIMGGAYPWAHQVFMEAKEHVFVLLPFLTLALWLMIRLLAKEQDEKLKKAAMFVAFITLSLGAFIALSGILISGAVR